MMPVDKGWYMRLHEAGLPSLIVLLGNDYKLTWNVCCNESDGHRLAAPSEHMLLCKQARWPVKAKFMGPRRHYNCILRFLPER